MTRFDSTSKQRVFTMLLSASLLTGGGIGSASPVANPRDKVAATEPSVISSSPSNWATNVPTSTNNGENVVIGTPVTATFSQPMDPTTVNSFSRGDLLTFTVRETTGNNVPGTVVMNAANTEATFTPISSVLKPNTSYTATVTAAAMSANGVSMANPITWSFTTNPVVFTGQSPVPLGEAGIFAILTKSGITDVPPSAISGDIGTSPITGAAIHVTCAEMVTGTIYSVNAAGPLPCRVTDPTLLTTAVANMQAAYTNAAGRKLPNFVNLGAGQIGGLTLVPGLYKWSTGVLISTSVTLSGSASDVWIFQIAGNLTQASGTKMILAGGALPKNIFWQTSDAVSIGTNAHVEGVLLSKTLIAMKTGASANARLFAQTAVTLQQTAVTQPAH
jgi:Ice-binding-like/Bacterial Ig-like domain